ncbi:MAG: hypothetical protein LBQ34_01320 [Alphaproteobacteria bacterium]|jgi:lipopolysaccharide biosynthesis glycosyltransferase|nr:hypothetical protein [Alphaproteobacteria bacterium]
MSYIFKEAAMNRYNITFSINREYLLFAMITLYSLLKNNQKHYFDVYILHDNCIKQSEIDKICSEFPLNQFNNFKIHLVDVSTFDMLKEMIKDFPERLHLSKETYFRLFMPYLLPNVDKILHLDTDVLVRGDITDFLNTDMGNNLFLADRYYYNTYDAPRDDYTKLGYCAGVLYLNLQELRKQDFLDNFKKEFKLNNKLDEEQFMNKVYLDKIMATPENYVYTIGFRSPRKLHTNTKIIHYIALKPYVLQRFKTKDLTRKGIKEYFPYLEDFIEPKFKWQFKLIKYYVFSFGSTVNSLERRVRSEWNKRILKKDNFYAKSNWFTSRIHKYAIIKKS